MTIDELLNRFELNRNNVLGNDCMKEKYRIYNYLKNHEGALIALVSGMVGFVVMTLNFVLYITDRFYLSEWNCNLIYSSFL